jgi:hypothetical protein
MGTKPLYWILTGPSFAVLRFSVVNGPFPFYRRGLIAAYVDGFVLACGGKCTNKSSPTRSGHT